MADTPELPSRTRLPDVVVDAAASDPATLDWVGMDGIELPLRGAEGEPGTVARVSAWVNLVDGRQRGIHMSRLYRALDEGLADREPTPERLRAVLAAFLHSHGGLSDRARLRLRYALPVRRSALRSGLGGWRAYPVDVVAEAGPSGERFDLGVAVEYSSTCPGSAALARQLVQQAFERDFPLELPGREAWLEWLGSARGLCATPHAQRSRADVRVRCAPGACIDAPGLIDRVEAALQTPVQTAVKREDEQEFARLNGAHPMYCEDAVRRIRTALDGLPGVLDWSVRAAHLESLHPHDAVAAAVRGVPGGFVAVPD